MKHKLLFVIVASLLIVIITNSCSKKTTEPDSQPGRLIFVQGGTFNPENGDGTPSNCYVTLSSFYIDKYEVTQASYQNIMGTNPSIFAGNPKRPVEQVSWLKAIEYCNRRSMKDKLTPCYSYDAYGTDPDNWPAGWNDHTKVSCQWNANGYRLPTEMEWMYAAKGGINSQGYHYSGSSYLNTVARNGNNSEGRTWDVGSLSANELGIYDMCGNVSEWVWDKADYPMSPYPGDNWTNPTGPATGSSRIFRGGGVITALTVIARFGIVHSVDRMACVAPGDFLDTRLLSFLTLYNITEDSSHPNHSSDFNAFISWRMRQALLRNMQL